MFLRLFNFAYVDWLTTTTLSGIGSKKTKYELIYEVCNEPDPLIFADLPPLFNRAAMGRARFLLCTGFIFFSSFFNRAAMGRARFLLYTGFIINRAAMGRARFLLCTGFIINRAAMGRARFLLCTGFIFFRRFCLFFVGDQTQTSPRPNHNWDFESRKLGCLFAKSY